MTISICIIAYNEEKMLPKLLGDIKRQDYPADKIEIILIDSCSTDCTRNVMENFARENVQYIRVCVVENKQGGQAAGWNTAIRASDEEVIIRIDAHARVPKDFVSNNVRCLESGEDVSGGPRASLPEEDTTWQRLLLSAESSMFGSGIAEFRRTSGRRYVKSMFHAAYRREVFDKAGLFNENLGRTEDNEMHYRIRKAGYQLCYDPTIYSYQYTRSSLGSMMKQKFGNGYWVTLTLKVCPQCLSLYHFVPLVFILAIIGTSTRIILGKPLCAIVMWCSYWFAAIAMSLTAVKEQTKHIVQMVLPILFFLLHLSYGFGSLLGVLNLPFKKLKSMHREDTKNE